jgi:hypothetical protein
MKKEFNNPIIEVITIQTEDIIKTSSYTPGSFGDPSDGSGSIGDLF